MPRYQKGKEIRWMPLMVALALVFGVLLGWRLALISPSDKMLVVKPHKNQTYNSVDEVLSYIQNKYVDEIDLSSISESLIQQALDSLDPHSIYISSLDATDVERRMQGEFKGIGIEYLYIQDTPYIQRVIEDGPSDRAGIEVGDALLKIGEASTIWSEDQPVLLYELIQQQENSVELTVSEKCTEETETLTLQKAVLPTSDLISICTLENDLIYLGIEEFYGATSKMILDSLERYTSNGKVPYLILDLRGNPGGYLQEAIKIINQIIRQKDALLLYTQGAHSSKQEYKSAGKFFFEIDSVAVLIDEYSASASEIVAGVLQDWDRGVIVGRRSFGKGLVQEQFSLTGGAKLRLTVAKYYLPSGRLIQKDYKHHIYNQDFSDRNNSGEYYNANNIPIIDSAIYLSAAGDTLYSQRGIVPDLFVPHDSFLYSNTYIDILDFARLAALDLNCFSDETELAPEIQKSWKACLARLKSINATNKTEAELYTYYERAMLDEYYYLSKGPKTSLEYKLTFDPCIKAVREHWSK